SGDPTTTPADTTPGQPDPTETTTEPVVTEPGETTTEPVVTEPGTTPTSQGTTPGTTPTSGGTTPTTPGTTPTTPGTTPTTGAATKSNLYLGLPSGYEVTSKTIVDNFIKKNPNITVKLDTSDWGVFTGGIAAKIAAKTCPDVWVQENAVVLGYGKDGIAADLAAYIARDLNASDYAPKLFSAKVGTKVWGVPHGANPIALAYNKAIFDKAGEAYPTDNWTYDKMIEVAKKLNNPDTAKRVYGFLTTMNITQGWFPWIKSTGGNCLDATLTKADFTNPKTYEGITKWANTFLVDKIAPDTSMATTDLFGMQKGAMVFLQYSETVSVNNKYKNLDYDTVMIPKATDGKRYVPSIDNSWVVFSGAKDSSKDAAWEWIKYYLSAEGQDEVAKKGAAVPIRLSSMSKIDTTTKPKNKAAFTKGMAEGGVTTDESPVWNLWRRPANTIFMEIYEGSKTVDAGLKEIQLKVQKILDDNK
ncbi:MAG: sugar ABC transporter substrate-binding protein, partial [Eubacteriales bacterium]|nr:sugar ABC transporter substrate-binding protein [Eubacteriales bacterium]